MRKMSEGKVRVQEIQILEIKRKGPFA